MAEDFSPRSLRPRRCAAPVDLNIDSPLKSYPRKFKLSQSSQPSRLQSVGDTDSKGKSPTTVSFVDEAEQISANFLIQDSHNSALMRDAAISTSSSTTGDEGEDLCIGV